MTSNTALTDVELAFHRRAEAEACERAHATKNVETRKTHFDTAQLHADVLAANRNRRTAQPDQ